MVMWFREGGAMMYAIVATDLGLLVGVGLVFLFAIVARFVPKLLWPARVLAGLGLLGTALPLLVGAFGWWQGMTMMRQALAHADPSMRDMMEAQGTAMAQIPLWFGLGSTVIAGCCALVALIIAAIPGRAASAE